MVVIKLFKNSEVYSILRIRNKDYLTLAFKFAQTWQRKDKLHNSFKIEYKNKDQPIYQAATMGKNPK